MIFKVTFWPKDHLPGHRKKKNWEDLKLRFYLNFRPLKTASKAFTALRKNPGYNQIRPNPGIWKFKFPEIQANPGNCIFQVQKMAFSWKRSNFRFLPEKFFPRKWSFSRPRNVPCKGIFREIVNSIFLEVSLRKSELTHRYEITFLSVWGYEGQARRPEPWRVQSYCRVFWRKKK